MKVILTEKPSVARDIALFLKANSKKDGYFEGSGYWVTWAFGHLVMLKEPNDYSPELKRWSLAPLPFIPKNFELKLIKNKSSYKQFLVIKRLFCKASELICATDAGREGELIFRYILSMAKCDKKNFKRLWLSSLTEEAIQEGFQNLRPGSDFDKLYAAAKCRNESDWIVGLNATRNFTIRYGAGKNLWSVGRVQTPILSLIQERDDEISHFHPEPFWELIAQFHEIAFRCKKGRFMKKNDALTLLEEIKKHPLIIEKIQAKKEKNPPPLLYDLTTLQKEMNKHYGISAANTLSIAQDLYENKSITYPRTDSRYLSGDMKKKIPEILKNLQNIKQKEIEKLDIASLSFTSRIINDKKVTDHHAIIPTGKRPPQLPKKSQEVYEAILLRLIAIFYPPCQKETTTITASINEIPFEAKSAHILSPGWTSLYPQREKEEKKNKNPQKLPKLTVGMSGPHKPSIKEGKTTPPLHFTESSLLGSMETAGKFIDNDELKEAIKDKGLGTPATRAAMIETLLKRGYIARNRKKITITDRGKYLIALIQDPNLKSAELTGEWESKLKKIEYGHLNPSQFMNDIIHFTRRLIQTSDVSIIDEKQIGSCPKCGQSIIEGKRGYGCSSWKNGCTFVLWKDYKNFKIHLEQAKKLIQKKILIQPINIREYKNPVVLCLSKKGEVVELSLPERLSSKKQVK